MYRTTEERDIEIMIRNLSIVFKCLAWLTLMVSCSVSANDSALDDAVKRYYAGFPDDAVSMLKPLALSGDVDAQYLLGNILYSLSQSESSWSSEDAVNWYKMAANQGSADASYAVGIIFHKRWKHSGSKENAATAIAYYENAVRLGQLEAQEPLRKIKSQAGNAPGEAATAMTAKVQNPSPTKPAETGESTIIASRVGARNAESPAEQSIDTAKPPRQPVADDDLSSVSASASQVERNTDLSDGTVGQSRTVITIDEVASFCSQYTESGFSIYAETIKGDLFTGQASIVAINPDPARTGSYSIKLTNNEYVPSITVELGGVPRNIATRLRNGGNFGMQGVVLDSKSMGSNCVLSLEYLPV